MSEIKTKEQSSTDFEDYIADLLTSALAEKNEGGDLLLRDEEGQLVYVDAEDQSLWVISAHRAWVKT